MYIREKYESDRKPDRIKKILISVHSNGITLDFINQYLGQTWSAELSNCLIYNPHITAHEKIYTGECGEEGTLKCQEGNQMNAPKSLAVEAEIHWNWDNLAC